MKTARKGSHGVVAFEPRPQWGPVSKRPSDAPKSTELQVLIPRAAAAPSCKTKPEVGQCEGGWFAVPTHFTCTHRAYPRTLFFYLIVSVFVAFFETMSDEDDYRPKSPDLNFGQEGPSQPQTQPHLSQQHQHQHQHQFHQYQQPPPLRVNPSATQQPNWYQPQTDYTHSRSYSFSASAQSPTGQGFNYSYQPLSATTPSYNATVESPRFPPYHQQQNPYQAQQHQYQQQQYFPPAIPQGASTYDNSTWQNPYSQLKEEDAPQTGYDAHPPQLKKEEDDHSNSTTQVKLKIEDEAAPEDTKMPPRRAAAAAAAAAVAADAADVGDTANEASAASAVGIEPSPVRTKFPTARIKRIMQADEEVGKVAQQTPIAVGKALELFMIQLVTKSAEVARSKSSKRVTPAMLKSVVEEDDQWDFLRDIVLKVEPDKEGSGAGSKGKAVKAESDSEEDSDVPKKKRGGGRKKKTA